MLRKFLFLLSLITIAIVPLYLLDLYLEWVILGIVQLASGCFAFAALASRRRTELLGMAAAGCHLAVIALWWILPQVIGGEMAEGVGMLVESGLIIPILGPNVASIFVLFMLRWLPWNEFISQDARCTECGYDLRGSRLSTTCPECGASIPERPRCRRQARRNADLQSMLALDFSSITTADELHHYLASKLAFGDGYPANWEAFRAYLPDPEKSRLPMVIHAHGWTKLETALPKDAETLRHIVDDFVARGTDCQVMWD